MTDKDNAKFEIPFHSQEQLMLHQLRLLEWMATTGRKRFVDENTDAEETEKQPGVLPGKWELTKGVQPYEWQQKCIDNIQITKSLADASAVVSRACRSSGLKPEMQGSARCPLMAQSGHGLM